MADLGATAGVVTLAQWAKHLGPNGQIAKIVETLSQTNDILEDMPWFPANMALAHRITRRLSNGGTTGLPTGTWREINGGVDAEIELTEQLDEGMGMLETYSDVDKALVRINGNEPAWRWQKDKAFVEGLGQTMAPNLFAGSTLTSPNSFDGLSRRYTTLGTQCIGGGGSGSGTLYQFYVVLWGENQVYGIHPPGTPAGLQQEDLGTQTKVLSSGKMLQVLRTHFEWNAGLAVEDERAIVRVCNIDPSALVKTGATGADLPDLLCQVLDRFPKALNKTRGAIYMTSTLKGWFRRQMSNRSNIWLKPNEFGKMQLMFDEFPIRQCDTIPLHSTIS